MTPSELMAEIATCVISAINPEDAQEDRLLLYGGKGSTTAQPCCSNDGLLGIEYVSTNEQGRVDLVTGYPCTAEYPMRFDVVSRRCWKSFDSNGTGAATGEADFNKQGIAAVNEAWAIMQALLCCTFSIPPERIFQKMTEPNGGCAGSITTIEFDMEVCCAQ